VFNGCKDVAALLLASKTEVNARSNDGRTPLHDAAIGGNDETKPIELPGISCAPALSHHFLKTSW
jgi:ankyrin repeat protein